MSLKWGSTFRGWLVVWHKSSVPGPAFTFNWIFSFLEIFFTAGVTYSGKLNGIHKENWPLLCNTLWDQLTLIERLEPPSTCRYNLMNDGTSTLNNKGDKYDGIFSYTSGTVNVNMWGFMKAPFSALATFSTSFFSPTAICWVQYVLLGVPTSTPRTEPC